MKNLPTTVKSDGRLKLTYLYGGSMLYDPSEILGPRLLTGFEGVLIMKGHPTYEAQNGKFRLKLGSIVLAQPGSHQTYHGDPNSITQHAYFCFDLEEIPADWLDFATWPNDQTHPSRSLTETFRHIMARPVRDPSISDNRLLASFFDLYLNPMRKSFAEPLPSGFRRKSLCKF